MQLAGQVGSFVLQSEHCSETKRGDTSTFTRVDFPEPFPEGAKVIVIPMVQTFDGADTPGIRIADVSNTGFKIRMNEIVDQGRLAHDYEGRHGPETIGWVAFTL